MLTVVVSAAVVVAVACYIVHASSWHSGDVFVPPSPSNGDDEQPLVVEGHHEDQRGSCVIHKVAVDEHKRQQQQLRLDVVAGDGGKGE